jgi:hypothetical protein
VSKPSKLYPLANNTSSTRTLYAVSKFDTKSTDIILTVQRIETMNEQDYLISHDTFILPKEVAQQISTLLFQVTHAEP